MKLCIWQIYQQLFFNYFCLYKANHLPLQTRVLLFSSSIHSSPRTSLHRFYTFPYRYALPLPTLLISCIFLSPISLYSSFSTCLPNYKHFCLVLLHLLFNTIGMKPISYLVRPPILLLWLGICCYLELSIRSVIWDYRSVLI